MNTLRSLLLAALCVLPAAAAEQLGLREGEALTYRVSWGLFQKAGEIKITTAAETNDGVPQTVVTTSTTTTGVLKRLFPFNARAESIFNRNTGRLDVHTEASASGKKRTNMALVFDYDAMTARYSDFVETHKSTTVPIPPPGYPKDLITTLIHTRTWDLQPGEKQDADVVFEDDIYQLTIYALGYETVETPLGTFKTLKLEPRMEKTPPLGMFRRGSKVHVWIAVEDPRRLPVKFEVEFKFGAGVSTLIDYQPPEPSK
jgi:Protein of unknown function (DUF3108).